MLAASEQPKTQNPWQCPKLLDRTKLPASTKVCTLSGRKNNDDVNEKDILLQRLHTMYVIKTKFKKLPRCSFRYSMLNVIVYG